MLIKVTGVTIENVVKGKARYSVAKVSYLFTDQPRTQNIMSFVNPGIYKQVSEWENNLPSGDVSVTLTKNSAGYNEWAAIEILDGTSTGGSTPTPATGVTKVVGSNYETKEERAFRQVLIVRQSCLAQAIASQGEEAKNRSIEAILETARQFEEWVFRKD